MRISEVNVSSTSRHLKHSGSRPKVLLQQFSSRAGWCMFRIIKGYVFLGNENRKMSTRRQHGSALAWIQNFNFFKDSKSWIFLISLPIPSNEIVQHGYFDCFTSSQRVKILSRVGDWRWHGLCCQRQVPGAANGPRFRRFIQPGEL